MGNIFSADLVIELYKWSSAEFPEESALVYTSVTDKSKFSIFRLSVRPEKVLLRLADSLCHDHPVRLHMELTSERYNNGYFNLRVVRVVVVGANNNLDREVNVLGANTSFDYTCVSRACSYHVCKGGNLLGNIFGSVSDMTWEVYHTYNVSLRTFIRFYVNIECDKVTGLSAKFRGPFKFQVPAFVTESMIQRSTSLIQREVIGEVPPKAINAFLESEFTGKEYILFQQAEGKGNSGTQASGQGARVIVNTAAQFHGNGNGSKYENCNIVMNYKPAKATN